MICSNFHNFNFDLQSISKVCQEAPRPYTSTKKIEEIYDCLKQSKRPLLVIGKGAAYAQAEGEIRKLVDRLGIPFLPTPMGKGLVSDYHDFCIAAARSTYISLYIFYQF